MIRHFLKLVWRRKRSNALVMAEIFLSFLVVFAVLTIALSMISGWRRPLGYDWQDVWVIRIVSPDEEGIGGPGEQDPHAATLERVVREVRAFAEVEAAALSNTPPYFEGSWTGSWTIDGRRVEVTRDEVTDGFDAVYRVEPVRGRWFGPEDDAMSFVPVVVDADLAADYFGAADPIGKKIEENPSTEYRVVGVVPPFRKDGEFSGPKVNMLFFRKSFVKPSGRMPGNLVVRIRPGTPASFEAELTRHLHSIAPDLSFRVRRAERMREASIRMRTTPVIVLGVVGLFLIAMVCLGLTGVLWQTVTRRTREIGLRRALGASGGSVRSQVVLEVTLVTSLAVIVGLALVLQLPMLGIFRFIVPPVFASGIAGAMVVIYLMTFACALYPGWMASRVEPAEALRYE